MKKSFCFFLLTGILATTLNKDVLAQQHTDLQLSVVSPQPDAVFPSGDTVELTYSVKNLGPGTVDSSSLIYISNGGIFSSPFPAVILAPGDSTERTVLYAWNENEQDEEMSFCFYLNHNLMPEIIDSNKSNDTACVTFTIQGSNHTGIADNKINLPEEFQLFPNPAQGIVWLKFYSATQKRIAVKVFDALGREVLSANFDVSAGWHDKPMDISKLSSGLYFVKIQDGRTAKAEKLYVD